jgi:hypothetical protein
MNWTKTSAVAEILSSVAILATLVYLGIEINQNAEATQADTRQSMLASDQQLLQLIIEKPDLHILWYKPELNDEEKVRLSYFLVLHFRMRENNWLQNQNGILDDATWLSYRSSILAILSSPRTRHWWHNFGVERLYDPEFNIVVDELIADAPIFERSAHISVFD